MLPFRKTKSLLIESLPDNSQNIYEMHQGSSRARKQTSYTTPQVGLINLPIEIRLAIQRLKTISLSQDSYQMDAQFSENYEKKVIKKKQSCKELSERKIPTESIKKWFYEMSEQVNQQSKPSQIKDNNEVQIDNNDPFREEIQEIQIGNTCEICFNKIERSQMEIFYPCRHAFCNECLQAYFIYKINVMQELVCPQENCLSIYNQDKSIQKIISLLPLNIQNRYKKHLFWRQNLKKQNIKLCPEQQCIDGIIDINRKPFVCFRCQTLFCPECMMKMHGGSCGKNFQEKFQKFKRCPQCKMFIEKSQGCNHMTCKCGYEFDFISLKSWNHLIFIGTNDPFENWGAVKKVILGIILIILFPFLLILTPLMVVIEIVASLFYSLYQMLKHPSTWHVEITLCSKMMYFLLLPLLFVPLWLSYFIQFQVRNCRIFTNTLVSAIRRHLFFIRILLWREAI